MADIFHVNFPIKQNSNVLSLFLINLNKNNIKKICIFLLMLPVALIAQNYTEVQTGMKNFYYGASDMDGDGKQDIIINGASLVPYANLGNNATYLGDIKFIDFNNEGLADYYVTSSERNLFIKLKTKNKITAQKLMIK